MKRLLLVDDQPAVRALLTLELKNQGYEITTAANAAEAVQLIDEAPLDLVILDVLLPETDGLELLGWIKQKHPNLPVILLTGMGYEDNAIKEALVRGADGYVSKGLSMSQLVMEIHRVLRKDNSGGKISDFKLQISEGKA